MDEGHAACNMQHNNSQILDLMHHNEGNIRFGDFLNANPYDPQPTAIDNQCFLKNP